MKPSELRAILLKVQKTGKINTPADLRKALSSSPKAKKTWNDTTDIARRDWILWVISGRLEETRAKRIKKGIDMLSRGKKRVCCFEGLGWLLKQTKKAQ